MRSLLPHRRSTMLAVTCTLAVVAAACSSDDTATTSDATTPASTVDPVTTETTMSPDTSSSDTTTPDGDGLSTTAAPTTTAATPPAPTTAAPAGPLQEPSIGLLELGTFDQPVDVAAIPGDFRLFVVEQPGRVIVASDLSSDVALDITDLTSAQGERGLLGLAFHPTEDLGYVNFTDDDGDTVVAEFAVDPDSGEFDRESYREVLTVDQPYGNHNGGSLGFAPDGMLYIGLGDGGSGGDPERHALDLSSRLGKVLRIDPLPDGEQPFTVPDDNPFVGDPAADPTIWSYGLRNPWRFSFDSVTGDLWIADVGQGEIEEIDHAPATDRANAGKGLNFGWSALEGNDVFNTDQSPEGATAPVYVYGHENGRCSVSGGTVARRSAIPDLDGWYLFGDYCTGEIWALDPSAPVDSPRVVELAQLPGLSAVSTGPNDEIYAVSNGGAVMRVVAG